VAARPEMNVSDTQVKIREKTMSRDDAHVINDAPFDISGLTMLDDKQVGHLRNIHNLANQFPGDWSFMGGPDSWHAGGTLFKQLGALYWPLALAHYHHLPAAPAAFRDTSIKLIEKMRRVDVWGYWRDMSTSGPWYDKTLAGPREGWIDPVVKENIMYSGRLAVMAGMHSVLFDDDRYEQKGGLDLVYPYPYGGGPLTFEYDLGSLNETIYWQMAENGFLGVSCEPNMTFVVCNQYSIIAQRLNDIRRGTNVTSDLTRSFQTAWEQKGWVTEKGPLVVFYKPTEDFKRDPGYASVWDAYSLTFMNTWNPELVRELYARNFNETFRYGPDGTISIWPMQLAGQVHEAIAVGKDPELCVDFRSHVFDGGYYDLAFFLPFLSEVGDGERLSGLLAHADRFMQPTWRDGGLYYPRNDVSWNEEGHLTYMDPWCGNGSIAHARLNVKDGLRTFYNHPWEKEHFEQPALDGLSEKIDVLRAIFLTERNALVLTLRSVGPERSARLEISNAQRPSGKWTLYRNATKVASGNADQIDACDGVHAEWQDELLVVKTSVGDATNFVLTWS
jgi:hypothetical protein